MKKLLIAMGCIAAMIQISSCTSDSIEGLESTNNPKKFSATASDSLNVPNSIPVDDGGDDKDKVKL